jgi:hypothetical protein
VRIFPPELEERAFRRGLLKEWREARLVSPEAAAKIAAEIGEPPANAAWPLRVVLFGVAALCQASAIILALKGFQDGFALGIGSLLAAAASIALAEAMIRGLKVRRHGAEEALVAGAAVMAAFGVVRLVGPDAGGGSAATAVFSFALAAAAALAYARYGYRLAAIGVAVGLGVFLGALDYGERGTRVMLAALYAVLLAAITLWPGLPRRERERLEIARFFLALSVPLCLNLALERVWDGFSGQAAGVGMDAFAWAAFAAIFLIPAGWLAWGISSRARSLVWAGALGLLVALCSIKPYFGWTRRSWDPAVLGVELIVLALVLKRWLDAGAGGRRGGFSSEEMGDPRPGGALSLLAGTIAAGPASAPSGPETMKGRGGDFGGGGASGSF